LPTFAVVDRTSRIFSASNLSEAARTERILASARAVMAVFCLIAISSDPTPMRNPVFAYAALLLYGCVSFAFFIWTRRHAVRSRIIPFVHAADVLFIFLVSAFTQGPNGLSFFVFFTIVVLAAAYRWGFWETVLTGCTFLILFLIEGALIGPTGGMDLNRILARSTYLALVSVLLGYLAQNEKGTKDENALIARVLRVLQTDGELTSTIRTCLKIIADFYHARGALLVIQENATHRVFRWRYPTSADDRSARPYEMNPEEARTYLFWSSVPIWCWRGLRSESNCRAAALNETGQFISRLRFQPPEAFVEALSCDSVLAASDICGDDLAGRLYILDPQLESTESRAMRHLSRLLSELQPIVRNIYQWRRVRSKAHIIEQVRAAREIHDGIIQSLIGLELEIEALLHNDRHDTKSRLQLERVQKLLREQSQDARDLMQRMKTPAVMFRELIPFLDNLVTKFRYETGIHARFICDVEAPPLPANACHEVARIVQEALVNVRKHSRATNVEVKLTRDNDGLSLIIEDNGAGSHLESRGQGDGGRGQGWEPAVIRERVRLLNGTLMIESRPGSGARLMIQIPVSEHTDWWHGATQNETRSV
jgi:signal transduction histidine kinase